MAAIPPAAPTGLAATAGNAQVTLTWTANTETNLSGYNVYRATVTGGPYTKINPAVIAKPTVTYTDTALTNGTTYYYVISAVDIANNESAKSTEISTTPIAPPTAPVGLAATAGNAQVVLNWTANTETTLSGYNVYRATTVGGPYAKVNAALIAKPTIAYTDTALTNGTTYYYVITAVDIANNESVKSIEVSAAPLAPPAAPTGLTATAGNTQVTLSWTANTETTLAGYNVYRATTTGGPYTKINASLIAKPAVTYSDTGLTNGTAYYYVISAVNTANGESAKSTQVTVTPIAPPAAPTGLSGTPGNAQVVLNWTANTETTLAGYNVYRAATTGGPYTKINTIVIAKPATTYTDTGLTNGTAYYYVITAVNTANGESAQSTQASVTPITAPAAPTGLTAVPGNAQVALTWTANTETTLAGYNVYRATVAGGPYTKINASLIAKPTVTYTDAGLTNGTTYYYAISAADTANNESVKSGQVTATPSGNPIQYVYDELGRVVGAIDPFGENVHYTYDTVGNIASIEHNLTTAVSLLEFLPASGPIGTTVTLYGTGFSATLSQNLVKFNGTVATITAVNGNQLLVVVPSGATTGPITVTTPTGSVTSTSNFNVTTGTAVNVPTITAFTPTSGIAGTAVSITGTNFDPTGTKVTFNGALATIASITSTSLNVSVPTSSASGPIRVETVLGMATSATDFLVPPTGTNVADIIDTKRIQIGGSQSLNINVPSKVGLLLFDGVQGNMLTLDIPTLAVTPAAAVSYSVYSPRGDLILTGSISGPGSLHLPSLLYTGTYSIYFKPGTSTATLTASLNFNDTVVIDGPAKTKSTSFAGQTIRLTFNARTGQNVGLGISNLTLSPTTVNFAIVSIYKPDGSFLNNVGCYTTSACALELASLPVTGTYSIILVPNSTTTSSSFTATLSSDVATPLTLDGTPSSVSIARVGQIARLTFSGTAGQNVGLGISNVTLTTTGSNISVFAYKPDGSTLASTSCSKNSPCVLEMTNLPVTGTYSIVVAPFNSDGATGSFTATLSSDVVTPLTLDGTPSSVSIARVGQIARLTFSGTAGQNIGLGISNLTLSPTTVTSAVVYVYKPDGSILAGLGCYTPGPCASELANLPATGTYSITVTPNSGATGSFTATLSSDVTGTVVVDGTPTSVSTTRVGQIARLTFSGTAGQNIGLGISNLILTTASWASLSVYKPDGSILASNTCYTSGPCTVELASLPVTGTYSFNLVPNSTTTSSSFTATLSSDVTGTVVAGTAFNLNLSRVGQQARLSFSGTAAQNATLTFASITTSPVNQSVSFTVYTPTATYLSGTSTTGATATLPLTALPATGTYTLIVNVGSALSGSMTVTLGP